jgi:hypothetical protein
MTEVPAINTHTIHEPHKGKSAFGIVVSGESALKRGSNPDAGNARL